MTVTAASRAIPAEAAAEETDAIAANADPASELRADNDAGSAVAVTADEDGGPGFDEAAESAFRAEARARGETVVHVTAAVNGEPEESGGQPLPRLDELVSRIPANVRETLDDLFRARFVTVKRFPKKVLK